GPGGTRWASRAEGGGEAVKPCWGAAGELLRSSPWKMAAALQSKKKASSKAVARFFAPSLSGWGTGMAMGRGRKLAPEISMIGAWASAPNGQARRQRTRVRITRAPRGSGAELQHHSVLLQRITEMGRRRRERCSALHRGEDRGVEEVVARGTGEPGPIQLSGGGDEDRHLGHQADPLTVGDGLR